MLSYEVGCIPATPFIPFVNRFQAAHHAGTHNLDMRFNMYDDVFDQCDWSRDPEMSWDQLLDIRAQQIAAKNKPIVLYFSGGTDSYTIYKVFERNKIHLDVIYTYPRFDEEPESWVKVLDLFDQGLYDPTTKLIIRDNLPDAHDKTYSNPDWIWQGGIKIHFSVLGGEKESNNYVSNVLGTDDFVGIIGLEKPRLHFTSTGVYSYQDDENYARPMENKQIDCFYISPDLPDLHIKQSYMLLNYIKRLEPHAAVGDLIKYNDIHRPGMFDWLDYSILGCGRYGDLNRSDLQHRTMARTRLIIPTGKFQGHEYQGRGEKWFSSAVGTKRFKNYTAGIMNVVHDTAGKFLHVNPENFIGMRKFPSKMYQLTF